MSEQDSDMGPRFIWNFPLIRRIQSPTGIGSILSSMMQKRMEQQEVVQDSSDESADLSTHNTVESNTEVLDGIESSIENLEEDSSPFNPDDDTIYVEITDSGFDPQQVLVNAGDTVEWTNEGNEVHRISSVNNSKFASGLIDPGETYSHTFYNEDAIKYQDSTNPEIGYGGIIVGDIDVELDLTRLDDEEVKDDNGSMRSMSKAVEDKEDIDAGFEE